MAGLKRSLSPWVAGLRETGEMIAFKHTIFALPFAVIALISAADTGWPSARTWLWVLVAMVSARTAAMAFNRLADYDFDSKNPRTVNRALPAGRLDRQFAWIVTGASAAVFLIAAAALGPLCLALAPLALAVLLVYSYAKRFTAASHLWLGLSLGIAPIGAWIAETGRIDWPALVLAGAVALWVAGFDVIYSLQDEVFDREHDLHSLPARFGAERAITVARTFHIIAFVGFLAFALAAGGGMLRLLAVVSAGLLLAWQHRLIRSDDLQSIDAAFFTANGTLAMAMCIFFVVAKLISA
ncbi:MAG: putative 4-hydroxybenzoate polyprenyltransferase [Acidobacteria bacterium]|jgi:4-hydroxybenzoate polyprenyltransferase|nr:putative 4-hydroxybenzoate polyprenyltransferase [Acidobacteriota bacterium]